jgi:hypothetical protein
MRTAALALVGVLGVGMLGAVASAEDPQAVYDQLYGDEANKVARTADTKGDAAFAAKLLKDAKSVKDDPALADLLLEKASDFGARNPAGYAAAIEAISLLSERIPDRKFEWLEKLLKVTELQYKAAKGAEKADAGELFLDQLLATGDRAFDAEHYEEAVIVYQQAQQTASAIKSCLLEELSCKVKTANDRIAAQKKLATLETVMKTKPDDAATAKAIVLLCVQELDNPTDAAKHVEASNDERLKKLVPLAAKPVKDLAEAGCLELGEWYKGLAASASSSGKLVACGRAKACYEQFLAVHVKEDAEALKARRELQQIDRTLADLRPRKVFPGKEFSVQFNSLESIKAFWAKTPKRWHIAGNEYQGDDDLLVFGVYFKEISFVSIKGRILEPSKTNFRVGVGRIGMIFNWEMADMDRFHNGTSITSHQGHSLQPGKTQIITLERRGRRIVVCVDDEPVYTTAIADLSGTVAVYGSSIAISEIRITGVPDPDRKVTGPSDGLP